MTDRNDSGSLAGLLAQGQDEFVARHVGPAGDDVTQMLATIGAGSLDALVAETVPGSILLDPGNKPALSIGEARTEAAALAELAELASRNQVWRSYLGSGYHGTLTPEPIRRNVLENPGWYTAYTPYQAEISQGRLEALMVFQQMIIDLTGMEVANASLLDEATAAAEAMTMLRRASTSKAPGYFVEAGTHPQVIEVIRTRARWLEIPVTVGTLDALDPGTFYGAHLQNPDTEGRVRDLTDDIARLQAAGLKVCVGTDPLAAVLLKSAGAQGADVVIGSAQRFGIPLGFGGPHAAFMATRQKLIRTMPGRIIGTSHDAAGNIAYRMALQTREQHIRRDNIPAGSRLSHSKKNVLDAANWDQLEAFHSFCTERGITEVQAAFSWLAQQSPVTSVIAGATSAEQVRANAQAACLRFDAEDLAALDAIFPAPEKIALF